MNQVSATATTARESHRNPDGTFGNQPASESETDLPAASNSAGKRLVQAISVPLNDYDEDPEEITDRIEGMGPLQGLDELQDARWVGERLCELRRADLESAGQAPYGVGTPAVDITWDNDGMPDGLTVAVSAGDQMWLTESLDYRDLRYPNREATGTDAAAQYAEAIDASITRLQAKAARFA